MSRKAGYRERLHVQDRGRGRSSVGSLAFGAGAGYVPGSPYARRRCGRGELDGSGERLRVEVRLR
jgi:hypothetical protein